MTRSNRIDYQILNVFLPTFARVQLLSKSVIVTGASSGIGRTASIMLAKSGYKVFGLARSYDKLQALAKELPGESYVPVEFDIMRPDTFGFVTASIATRGDIYGLVNNAGYVEPGAIEDISMADLRIQFETNFFGLLGFTKQVLPLMLQKGEGRIVNVSSLAGLVTLPLIGAYCASKHALEAISDALKMELYNTGIKVVNINPGVIETSIHTITKSKTALLRNSRFASAYRKYLEHVPRGLPARVAAGAIVEAISSCNPKPRYIIGSGREKAGVRLRRYVPDRLFYSQVAKRLT
jgi:short-subunit dehydrogenase